MSRFFSSALSGIEPYVPGEQPKDRKYIKLNTNESPFPPSPAVLDAVTREQTADLRLYSDPTAAELVNALAEVFGTYPQNVFVGNGSDEVLAFAFYAYGENGFTGPDISYGFYPVFSQFFGIDYSTVALKSDLSLDPRDLINAKGSIVFANPNAQTGLYLTPEQIRNVVESDPDRVVIVDEAYIDFGGESVIPLTREYKNLLVVGTFSKSRSLAGARVGFAVGDGELISDLNTLKFSFNPYNLNRLSIVAGTAAVRDTEYTAKCTAEIIRVREWLKKELTDRGFKMTDSMANFLLVSHPGISGKDYFQRLRERGVLVRYLGDERIKNCVRITVGSAEQMEVLVRETDNILAEVDK